MPTPAEPNERKSRSLVNRPAARQTVLKLDDLELVMTDAVFESIWYQLKEIENHLPQE